MNPFASKAGADEDEPQMYVYYPTSPHPSESSHSRQPEGDTALPSPKPAQIPRTTETENRNSTASAAEHNFATIATTTPGAIKVPSSIKITNSVAQAPTTANRDSFSKPISTSPTHLTSFDDFTTPPPPSHPQHSPTDQGAGLLGANNVAAGLSNLYAKVKLIAFPKSKGDQEGEDSPEAQPPNSTPRPDSSTAKSSRAITTPERDLHTHPGQPHHKTNTPSPVLGSGLKEPAERVVLRGPSGDVVSIASIPPGTPGSITTETAGRLERPGPNHGPTTKLKADNPHRTANAPATPSHQSRQPDGSSQSEREGSTEPVPQKLYYSTPVPSKLMSLHSAPQPSVREITDGQATALRAKPPDQAILKGTNGGQLTVEGSALSLKNARDSIMALLGSGARWRLSKGPGRDGTAHSSPSNPNGTGSSTMTKPILEKRFWIKNDAAQYCFKCGRPFGTFNRKHHCRTCGHIFDSACMTNVPGDWLGLPPNSGKVRVCLPCKLIILARVESDDDMIEEEDEEFSTEAGANLPSASHGSESRFNLSATGDELPKMNIPVSVSMKQGTTTRPVLEIVPSPHTTAPYGFATSHAGTPIRPASSRKGRHMLSLAHREGHTPFRARDEWKYVSDGIGDQDMIPYTPDDRLDSSVHGRSRSDSVGTHHGGAHDGSPGFSGGNAGGLMGERRRSRLSFRASRPSLNLLKALGVESPRASSRPGSRLSTGRPTSGIAPGAPSQQPRRTAQELGSASISHVRRLLKQLLQDSEVEHVNKWLTTLLPMILHTVDQVDPNLQRNDNMDIRNYIKLKRIPGGRIEDSRVVSGVVFTKNIAVKDMRRKVLNPRIAIVTFPLEYAHTHEGVISLEPLISQESQHVENLIARIRAMDIDVLFAAQNVSSLAMKFLNQAGVVVVQHVKMSVLHAVSRCTGADLMGSIDRLSAGVSQVGTCDRFDVKTYITRREDCARKTVVVLSGCQAHLGATLVLRGAKRDVLGRVKRLAEFMCYVVYNLYLERSVLSDEGIADIPKRKSGTVVSHPEFPETVEDKNAGVGEVTPVGAIVPTDEKRDSNDAETSTFYADTVRKLRSRILSSSPRIAVTEPYALAKAQAEERRLARVRALRDRYAAQPGEDENGSVVDGCGDGTGGSSGSPETSRFKLVSPSMVHHAVEKPTRPVRDFLHALHASEYDQALAAHEAQKQQWLAYRHNEMFDPIQHQQISVLYSCVSVATGMPCWGPEVVRFGFYNEDEDYDDDGMNSECRGMEEKENRIPDISLGHHIRDLALTAGRPCGSVMCDRPRADHRWQYVHGSGQVTIRVERGPQIGMPNLGVRVCMWSICRDCGYESRVRPMSEGTWKYSFAKYLELTFWGVGLRLDEESELQEEEDPTLEVEFGRSLKAKRGPGPTPDQPGPMCQHDVHRRHVRYIALGNAVVSIQYDEIGLWEIVLPPGIVRWKVDADLEMKNAQYKKIEGAIEGFVASVKRRMGAMEHALRMMMPEEEREKMKEREKDRQREKEREKDKDKEKGREKPKDEKEKIQDDEKDKEREKGQEAAEVEAGSKAETDLGQTESLTEKQSDTSEKTSEKDKAKEKEKETAVEQPEEATPSATAQCQAELITLRARIEAEGIRFRQTLQRIYVQSKHYEVVPFDLALIEVYKSFLEWQEIFSRIEQDYFPSEVAISQLANTIMQEVEDPGSANEREDRDSGEKVAESESGGQPASDSKDAKDEKAKPGKTDTGPATDADATAPAAPNRREHEGEDGGSAAVESKDNRTDGTEHENPSEGDDLDGLGSSQDPLIKSGSNQPNEVGESQLSQSSKLPKSPHSPKTPPKSRIPRATVPSTKPPPVHSGPPPAGSKVGSSVPGSGADPAAVPPRRLSGHSKISNGQSFIPRSIFNPRLHALQQIHQRSLGHPMSGLSVGYGGSGASGFGLGLSSGLSGGNSQVQRLVVHFERQLKRALEEQRQKEISDKGRRGSRDLGRNRLLLQPVGKPETVARGESTETGDVARSLPPLPSEGENDVKEGRSGAVGEGETRSEEAPAVEVESGKSEKGDSTETQRSVPETGNEAAEREGQPLADSESSEASRPDTNEDPVEKPAADPATVSGDVESKPDTPHDAPGESEPEVLLPPAEVVERSALMRFLSSLWPKKPDPGWPPVESPLSGLEYQIVNMDFLLREDEPTSVVAMALSCSEYVARLANARSAGDPWTATLENTEEDKARFTFKFSSPTKGVRASCRVIYAAPFDSLRRKAGVAERFVESMARCRKFDSKGGKTKSLFLKTLDDRFIVKSLSPVEFDAFEKFAHAYFRFMKHTLYHGLSSALAKMMGVFEITIKTPGLGADFSEKVLVMENLFYDRFPDRRYDLKGSMRNRRIESTGESDEVLLDENLVERIFEQPVFAREHATRALAASVGNDSLFLSRVNVMDYSLIAGFDDRDREIAVGIIDCLRTYTLDKRFESWFKDRGSKNKPTIMSPKDYRKRFRAAMASYVLQAPAYWHHFYVNGAVLREDLAEGGWREEKEDDEP